MKRKYWLLLLVFAVLLNCRPVLADGDFYIVAVGGGVGTKITSVPYEIKTPGFYYLGGNLTYSGTGEAIIVTADDVTLDLMGFRLTNSGAKGSTVGISIVGRNYVEIRNGTVRGFFRGIFEWVGGTNHRAINIRATGNNYGIFFSGSNHLIKGCSASNNTEIGLGHYSGLITDCVASNNKTGIFLGGPGNVLGNAVFNNSNYNFKLGDAANAEYNIIVDRNSAFGLNPNYAIQAIPPSGVVITANNSGTP